MTFRTEQWSRMIECVCGFKTSDEAVYNNHRSAANCPAKNVASKDLDVIAFLKAEQLRLIEEREGLRARVKLLESELENWRTEAGWSKGIERNMSAELIQVMAELSQAKKDVLDAQLERDNALMVEQRDEWEAKSFVERTKARDAEDKRKQEIIDRLEAEARAK